MKNADSHKSKIVLGPEIVQEPESDPGPEIEPRPESEPESEIEFGNVQHSQPEIGLRPDQDRHFAVVPCGEIRELDLPIYVDLDVLRDMEAHARENTRVELGGVMLGRHHIDDEGNPFVVITDSLRARHYEATKGSFKFTHDTWNQITRERNEFRNDLEMVGWYHTHPGWGVFLSGMDLFICNNFFNRPLDVALVIDPCAGDRGWFQWSDSEPGRTRQTAAFYLISNRHRQNELNHFNDLFSNRNPVIHDPRFRQTAFSHELSHELEDTMINLVDNRRPIVEVAIVSMLLLQLFVVGLIGWRMTDTNRTAEAEKVAERLSGVEMRLHSDEQRRAATIREQAYAQILDTIVSDEKGPQGLVEKYAEIATQNQTLNENLEGQLARSQLALNENEQLSAQLAGEKNRFARIENELDETKKTLELVKVERSDLKSKLGINDGVAGKSIIPGWVFVTLGSIGLLVVGGIGGFLLHRFANSRDEDQFDRNASAINSEVSQPGGIETGLKAKTWK